MAIFGAANRIAYRKTGKNSERARELRPQTFIFALQFVKTGTNARQMGSTNAYTEDGGGSGYEWTIVDRIFEHSYRRRNRLANRFYRKRFYQSETYQHSWTPTANTTKFIGGVLAKISEWAELVSMDKALR